MAILDDIQTHLVSAGVVDGATGWTSRLSYLSPDPDKVIAIFEDGSLEPPDNTESTKYDLVSIRIIMRGERFGYEALRTKWDDVFTNLHDATISGMVYIYAMQSGPTPLGYDESDRPELQVLFKAYKSRS